MNFSDIAQVLMEQELFELETLEKSLIQEAEARHELACAGIRQGLDQLRGSILKRYGKEADNAIIE